MKQPLVGGQTPLRPTLWVTNTAVRPVVALTARRSSWSRSRVSASSAANGSSRSSSEVRGHGQRAGDGHALLLPTRDLPGAPTRQVGEADLGQQLLAPLRRCFARDVRRDQREVDVAAHGLPREQARLLEHQPALTAGPGWHDRARCTVPVVGSSKPAISRSRVLLPQPDAPTSTRNSPADTARSTGPRAA